MSVNLITVAPEAKVLECIFLMKKNKIRFLPVTKGTQLLGIVTDRDLRSPVKNLHDLELAKLYRTEGDIRVGDFMTTKLITITPQDHIVTAANLLVKNKIGGLPVVESAHSQFLVGVITITDMLKAFVDLADRTNY